MSSKPNEVDAAFSSQRLLRRCKIHFGCNSEQSRPGNCNGVVAEYVLLQQPFAFLPGRRHRAVFAAGVAFAPQFALLGGTMLTF